MDKIYKWIINYIFKKRGRHFVLSEVVNYYENDDEFKMHNSVIRYNILLTELHLCSNILYDNINNYDNLNSIKEVLDSAFYIAVNRINTAE